MAVFCPISKTSVCPSEVAGKVTITVGGSIHMFLKLDQLSCSASGVFGTSLFCFMQVLFLKHNINIQPNFTTSVQVTTFKDQAVEVSMISHLGTRTLAA